MKFIKRKRNMREGLVVRPNKQGRYRLINKICWSFNDSVSYFLVSETERIMDYVLPERRIWFFVL